MPICYLLTRPDGKRPGEYFTDQDWNLDSTIDGGGFHPYLLSKRLAEETAWEIAKEKGIDLVVVNPAFVLGPPRSHRVEGVSIAAMIDWYETSQLRLQYELAVYVHFARSFIFCRLQYSRLQVEIW